MVELMELPIESLELIVSKLPLKTILVCKRVSKSLFDLISSFKSNPHGFTTSLFSQNPNTHNNLIYQSSARPINSVYLIDAHLDLINRPSSSKLQLSPFYTIPKFKGDELGEFHELALVNSCNGLLFLSSISTKPFSLICSIVCNPVTNEYFQIPQIFIGKTSSSSFWLGFSPISRKYKIICFNKKRFSETLDAFIHVVGCSSIKTIQSDDEQSLDYNINWDSSYTFLNGTGYWLRQKNYQSDFIISFDFENEVLGKINPPPSFDEKCLDLMGIGAVGDCLCLVDNSGDNHLDIWMMTSGGDWAKKFTRKNKPPQLCGIMLRPLQEMSNGDIMMVSSHKRILFYDVNRNRFRLIKLANLGSSVSTFVPSFVSIKHTLSLTTEGQLEG